MRRWLVMGLVALVACTYEDDDPSSGRSTQTEEPPGGSGGYGNAGAVSSGSSASGGSAGSVGPATQMGGPSTGLGSAGDGGGGQPLPPPVRPVYTDAGACNVVANLNGSNSCSGALLDYDCDVAGWECAPGAEIDAVEGMPCTQCVSTGTSETAGDMETFLTRLIHDSCQNRCSVAADCFAFRIGSSCGTCDVVLNGYTDEEVIGAAEVFDTTYCEGDGAATPLPFGTACVDGVCVFAR